MSISSINTNPASLVAQKNLNASGRSQTTSIERLSSGLRVNSAKDDAAGLAIAERLLAQTKGQEVAKRNAADGVSALSVADGGLSTIGDNIQRARELKVQYENGTLTAEDKANLDLEFAEIQAQITDVIGKTEFNGTNLLNNATAVSIQVGANTADTFTITGANLVAGGTEITDITGAADLAAVSLDQFDTGIDKVSETRAQFGAKTNRLESIVQNLDTSTTNLSAARGRIVDADFAKETANLTRTQVLVQAGTAVLTQANQIPNGVLSLLR